MLLRRIKLENFKKFKKLEREFGPGINVVSGAVNEIGKSTLLDGIVTALFENPKSVRKELEGKTTWGSGRRCKTAIEFEADGKRYLLEKDFEAGTLRLAGQDSGEEWDTVKKVAEKLRELLGTDSSKLFLATSCIRQNEVSNISSGKKEIGESLEGIVTGGNEETVASRVIEALVRQISTLNKGVDRPTNHPGEIARLTQEVEELRGELVQVKAEVVRVEQQKVDMVEVSYKLGEVFEKLAISETLLEKDKRRQNIEAAIGRLAEEYDNIEALRQKIQEAEFGLKTIDGFDDRQKVRDIGTQLAELEAERKNIGDDLPARRNEFEKTREQFKERRLLNGVASRISLIMGFLVTIAGFSAIVFNLASLAAGIIGLVFLVGVMWARSFLVREQTQLSGLQGRIRQMEEALERLDEKELTVLSRVNCATVSEFRQKEKMHRQLIEQKDAAHNQLLGKLNAQAPEQIEPKQLEMARALAEEKAKLSDDLKSIRLTPEEYVKLEKEEKALRTSREQLERRKLECELDIGKARVNAEDQIQMEETLEAKENTLKHEQRKLRAYQLTRDFVIRAREETLLSATERLQVEIETNLEVFTDGKYKKVMVDEGSLDFRIYSEEKGDWVKPEELSGGVIDEFYLACRLALLRLLYGDTQPPLILDDPFVNFDQPRMERTLQFLVQLSKEHQVIIFTLREDYSNIADRVIQLT